MSPGDRHPGAERLEALLRGELDPDEVVDVESHLIGCQSCREQLDLLRVLEKAGSDERWRLPSSKALKRSLRLPDDPGIPTLPEEAEQLELAASDIRGAGVAAVDGAHMLARNHPDARITLMVRPPAADGRWLITGRVWPRGQGRRPTVVVLTDHDHVLSRAEPGRGETFRIEEVASAGWTLEIHLPAGSCLLVSNPVP